MVVCAYVQLSGPPGDYSLHYQAREHSAHTVTQFTQSQDQANRLDVDLRAPNHDADLAFNSLKIAANKE